LVSAYTLSKRKVTGAHFTPTELARFVANRVIQYMDEVDKRHIRVLDPCCGDGELLLAFHERAKANGLQNCCLVGIEKDARALESARRRMRKANCKVDWLNADFLEMGEMQNSLWSTGLNFDKADVIIANPPYVRTQILGSQTAQQLAKRYNLTGRVDLYHVFLVAMTSQLIEGGLMGVISSNRFLSTIGGASIRGFMWKSYDVLEVVDLGDTKLFGAAVLPAVFVGRKKNGNKQSACDGLSRAQFVRIYEEDDEAGKRFGELAQVKSVYDILKAPKNQRYALGKRIYSVATGILQVPSNSSELWTMVTRQEKSWIERVENNSFCRISEVAKVRVGIKTTADKVFIRSDWDKLPEDIRPEKDLLRPLLSHDNVTRWGMSSGIDPLKKVLYTHELRNGERCAIRLDRYPQAAKYLQMHRKQLESRKYLIEAGRNWYEIWVPQSPLDWSIPKLVYPDISPKPKFMFDGMGCIVDGNCYWITLRAGVDPTVLFIILGVANSKLMKHYHDLSFQNRLYAGRRRYLTQYVNLYPLPKFDSEISEEIARLAKMLSLEKLSPEKQKPLEDKIDSLVRSAFEAP
jgi:adenine-specific DNA-methyltransferase